MSDEKQIDVEAGERHFADAKLGAPVYADESGAVAGESFAYGDTMYAKMQRAVGKMGVEQRGIERVPEDERTDTNLRKVATLWLSANMVVSSFAIGVLGPVVFRLSFVSSFLVVLFINILGITPVCFYSTFGPRFGLRQIILSRFWFGYYGVKLIAIFNGLACLGWSAVNVIVGAQLIAAVNPAVPGFAGILIIAISTLIITAFGYKIIHYYEYYAWIPSFIVFMIVLGEFAHSGAFNSLPLGTGAAETGSVLSFASSVFGFAVGWSSFAADYTVYQPADTSRLKVYLWTFAGLILPLVFVESFGAAVATAVDRSQLDFDDPALITDVWTKAYVDGSVGGLLNQVLTPNLGRFGQFCLVILALSIIANNCPNIYSLTFSLQVLARKTQAVPRFAWTFLGTGVYVAIAIPGYSRFEVVLEEFMLLIGYWLAIYSGVAIPEHFVFRRGIRGYEPAAYAHPERLPPGVAAVAAFGVGVAGAVLGMSQVFFIGPIGRHVGVPPFGGDVGFELAFAFTAVSYCLFRPLEKRLAKR